MSGDGVRCGLCHSGAVFAVTREGMPGAPQGLMYACRSHLGLASEKIAGSARAASVTVYLLNVKDSALGDGSQVAAADILERVRRIGAHSAGNPETAHSMEDALYLAVLTVIAHGAQRPAELASAALMSRRYEFTRWSG